jgi:hypothetical protein
VAFQPRIRINDVDVWGGGFSAKAWAQGAVLQLNSSGTDTLTGSLHSGIRANEGDIVTLVTLKLPATGLNGNPTTYASGYLADAQ